MKYSRKTIFLDSCAFDPKYYPEDKASSNLFELKKKNKIRLMIAHSTVKEIEHPNTPIWVKKEALKMVYTKETGLTMQEREKKQSFAYYCFQGIKGSS